MAAVKAPGFGDRRKAMLQDIAVLTNGNVISEEVGFKLENAVVSDLGRAKRVVVDKDNTTLIDGGGEDSKIQGRINAGQPPAADFALSKLATVVNGIKMIAETTDGRIFLGVRKAAMENELLGLMPYDPKAAILKQGIADIEIELEKIPSRSADEAKKLSDKRNLLAMELRLHSDPAKIAAVRQEIADIEYQLGVVTKMNPLVKPAVKPIIPPKCLFCAFEPRWVELLTDGPPPAWRPALYPPDGIPDVEGSKVVQLPLCETHYRRRVLLYVQGASRPSEQIIRWDQPPAQFHRIKTEADEPTVTCPHCNGEKTVTAGLDEQSCPTCLGVGRISLRKFRSLLPHKPPIDPETGNEPPF